MKAQVPVAGWAFTTLCLVSYTATFSHGASLVACVDMKPKHIRAQLQIPRNNYIIIHSNMSTFSPGDKVAVTVRSSRDFMGFLLQARRVSNDEVAGTFVFVPSVSKLMNCFKKDDTVTHSDKSLKRNLFFVWKAPDQHTGDIKFFLSVVQSYFVYWARIESVVVSQQTQNRTLSDRSEEPGPEGQAPMLLRPVRIVPLLQLLRSGRWLLHPEKSNSGKGAHSSPTAPGTPRPFLNCEQNGQQEKPEGLKGNDEATLTILYFLFGMSKELRDSWLDGEKVAEGQFASFLRGFTLSVSEGLEQYSVYSDPWDFFVLTRAPLPTATLFPAHLLSPQHLSATEAVPQLVNGEASLIIPGNAPTTSQQVATRESAIPKASANFLSQSATGGEEEEGQERKEGDKKEDSGHTLPWVTKPMPGTARPGRDGGGSHQETESMAAQLGILLCLSATLGMALAALLRCLHAQYCHKRTEVSFSEPDSDILARTDSEEVMHVKKILENSFVLVQAEYNWITPTAGMKKTLV
ncbi:reelin domain-containing protein 1 [Tachyglossus aculeatus]|uniref:reelin domain-containing protein 1 n=1 Tax=Tachyglossus aculeatus TaxID=9261 RepID=UPI0018F40B14|nr:reelin domain-containing protein 1 [Tachyglossus aculeatus]